MSNKYVMETISIVRGTTRKIPITYKKGLFPITGFTYWFTVRDEIPATSVSADTDAKIAKRQLPADLTDPENGKTTIELTPTDTNIDTGKYIYDIQYKTDTGEIYSSGIGQFIIEPDITRATT
jgi:hypothetical protein